MKGGVHKVAKVANVAKVASVRYGECYGLKSSSLIGTDDECHFLSVPYVVSQATLNSVKCSVKCSACDAPLNRKLPSRTE